MSIATRFALVRDERMHPQALAIALASAVVALGVALVAPRGALVTAAVLEAGIVAGELLVLRWRPAGELALSYAVFLVAVRGLALRDAVVVVLVAELVTLAADVGTGRRSGARVARSIAVGIAMVLAGHGAFALFGRREDVWVVVAALCVAAAAGAAIDAAMRRFAGDVEQTFWPEPALYAWTSVLASGVVMAIAVRGVDGRGALGTRGAVLLALPMLGVWWAYQQSAATGRMLGQAVEALAMVPALAGVVDLGAGPRVAALARHVGERVGLTPDEQTTLDVAARLQHLGAVTLDRDTDAHGNAAARATFDILGEVEAFAPAGEIVRRASAPRSVSMLDARGNLSASVLQKVAQFEFAREAGYDEAGALAALRAADSDRRSLATIDALERVLAGLTR
jgi:hypothetical protein